MFDPVSTYRIQFNSGFTFKQFEAIILYLQKLGIKTVYASPVFSATPGSTHGYDVTNPLSINPEIGTLDELRQISKKLKDVGIRWLQDIVPNHMAFDEHNAWLMDVLEKGRDSAYADFFDIDWNSPVYSGRLMVPFLGEQLDKVIEDGQLTVEINNEKLVLHYGEQHYPVNKVSAEKLLSEGESFDALANRLNHDTALLKQLCDTQHYALCYWQETDTHINYRRFFTVNGLICLNIQHQHVFDTYHQLIKQLVAEGVFQGLRVDHIDGLFDPKQYLERLRALAGDEVYVIVEKILEAGEQFPADWPVQGNTGYDMLALLNKLFTNTSAKKKMAAVYLNVTGLEHETEKAILEKKALILFTSMHGELDNLYSLFYQLELAGQEEIDTITHEAIKLAIAEVLVHCPVYRFYGNAIPLETPESDALKQLFLSIRKEKAELTAAADLLEDVLLNRVQQGNGDYNQRALRFYQRLMQFTGPLMAKGVEDTLLYTDSEFIDHNEVGDSPALFGLDIDEFHRLMILRQRQWPLGMNATSTHDTKRGEDVRARLNVLSDVPDDWAHTIKKWRKLNEDSGITASDEYFIYQTLLGAYPMPGQDDDDFENRLHEYLTKALREGKENSNWAAPNEEYEKAVQNFASLLLDKQSDFWVSFSTFHERVSAFGIINSLSQVLLKYTLSGMPDLYQGCELWDLSLVDPDNRRPVDYQQREARLKRIGKESWAKLWEEKFDGRLKLKLTTILLAERTKHAALFTEGEYIPLKVKGRYSDHVFAFARRYEGVWQIIAVPLHFAVISNSKSNVSLFDWGNTRVILPDDAPLRWTNPLTDKQGFVRDELPASELFADAPVALLRLHQPEITRAAGILLHITSLPSAFGIGDMGPQACRFADFLYKSFQQYWQMLPVNPVSAATGYSPYSATSAMAGNVLLISPELLVNDGWLKKADLPKKGEFKNRRVEFQKVQEAKNRFFDIAWNNFISETNTRTHQQFDQFKETEAAWLDEYALFDALRTVQDNKPWYQWPDEYKKRNKDTLTHFAEENADLLEKIKWLQFIFSKQWSSLKTYCNSKGVKLFGDMSFYISYDSVDVWSHPELFKLDKDGNIEGVAGVPPDYFSADGQLWGMPVYNWAAMKQQGYQWWVDRIKKNLDYFDLIRLDHFRAFAAYWEVPGGDVTAVNGSWQPGPGADLFETLKSELGELPFVAEDLGEITDDVYALRDRFGLPGMKVLQFAFDGAMPRSPHIPHNYTPNHFAYTGTHDNDTTQGWYTALGQKEKKRIRAYLHENPGGKKAYQTFARMCYASAAKVAILPMQDALGLDSDNRMNVPSSAAGNWAWRLQPRHLKGSVVRFLQDMVEMYNR